MALVGENILAELLILLRRLLLLLGVRVTGEHGIQVRAIGVREVGGWWIQDPGALLLK